MHAGLPDAGPFDPAKDQLDATVIRDTITVNGNSSLVLRYVANNPGATPAAAGAFYTKDSSKLTLAKQCIDEARSSIAGARGLLFEVSWHRELAA